MLADSLERYRPELLPDVRRFCRHLPNWGYVRRIIEWHEKSGYPGSCWVWRVRGRVAAFQAVAFLNPDDAWLWGMRVDPAFAGKGVATRFTRALFPVVRAAGRNWVGLNTLDHRTPRPTFRVAEKLGMSLDDTDAVDVFWNLPGRYRAPRLEKLRDIRGRFARAGRKTIFHQDPGWLWSRLLPARRRWLNPNGFALQGTPLHLVRQGLGRYSSWDLPSITVNLAERPDDLTRFVRPLLGLARGKHVLALAYRADWRREFHAALREVEPGLKRHRNCFWSCWRVYGRTV